MCKALKFLYSFFFSHKIGHYHCHQTKRKRKRKKVKGAESEKKGKLGIKMGNLGVRLCHVRYVCPDVYVSTTCESQKNIKSKVMALIFNKIHL